MEDLNSIWPDPPFYYKDFLTSPFPSPPPPIQGKYRIFGQDYTTSKDESTLNDLNIEILYDDSQDKIMQLKYLNHTLLLTFLKLIRILQHTPEKASEKIQFIRLILMNFHYLLNQFRQTQAKHELSLIFKNNHKLMQECVSSLKTDMDCVFKSIGSVENHHI